MRAFSRAIAIAANAHHIHLHLRLNKRREHWNERASLPVADFEVRGHIHKEQLDWERRWALGGIMLTPGISRSRLATARRLSSSSSRSPFFRAGTVPSSGKFYQKQTFTLSENTN